MITFPKGPEKEDFTRGKTRGLKLASSLSKTYDTLIKGSLSERIGPDFLAHSAFVATGGYGRSEIFPHSDIDLLLLVDDPSNIFEQGIKNFVYGLWDKNIDIGYSIRTSEESLSLCRKDIKVFTALLDARFITGSRNIFKAFRETFIKEILSHHNDDFIDEMVRMRKLRSGRHGDSVFVLEPDLKEGLGGIRDYNTSLWLLKVYFTARRFEELIARGLLKNRTLSDFRQALNFIFDIRHRLHFASNARGDRMTFDLQKKIALEKGLRSTSSATEVEKLMRSYYRSAERIDSFCELIIEKSRSLESDRKGDYRKPKKITRVFGRTDRHIVILSGKMFLKDPDNIIKAFELSKKHDLPLHNFLEEAILEFVLSLKAHEWSLESFRSFKKMFSNEKGLYKTLRNMNKLRVLESLIPEFKRIKGKYQQDIYHVYTVDAHSLKTVNEISKLKDKDKKSTFPFLAMLAGNLTRNEKTTLFMAALLHDIGKGRGKDHSKLGGNIARSIAAKLECSKDQIERISFLVENHLLMSVFSQRRNLDDPVMLHKFISKVGDLTNLRLLYLLTYGDLSSVSERGKAFTPWKNLLLKELFEKAVDLFSLGKYRKWIFGKEILSLKRTIVRQIKDREKRRRMRRYLGSLPESYFRSFGRGEIEEHFALFSSLGKKDFVYKAWLMQEYSITRLAFFTKDRRGLFASLAGALSAAKVNILSSLVFSTDDGMALDFFRVVGKDGGQIASDDPGWGDFESFMKLAINSRERFDEIIKDKLKMHTSILESGVPQRNPDLRFDNESSKDFSILEVYAADRLGLLYDLASLLSEFSINIHFAKISTVGDRAQDIFYLTDLKGKKITNRKLITAIKSKISKALAG